VKGAFFFPGNSRDVNGEECGEEEEKKNLVEEERSWL